MSLPQIELIWWEGCPSTEQTLSDLRQALSDLGLENAEVLSTEIRSDAQARAAAFVGSPTILVDGEDIAPPGEDEPVGLNCRIYRRRDGRISPTPDPEDVREALMRAIKRMEVSR
jgi:hypothetical protein